MVELIRCTSTHPEFKNLVFHLDNYLARINGEDHTFYAQFNETENLQNVVLLFENEKAMACGAFKKYSEDTVEIKRMYTLPEARGKGFATVVLKELEFWAKESGYQKCILETGNFMPDAMALYIKNGYQVIDNYGQYAGKEKSICFKKIISF